MIERAKATVGERNNRFFVDNVLHPEHREGAYDAVICVRVLINLADLSEQRQAIRMMTEATKPAGLLGSLVEGFTDGFDALSRQREAIHLPALEPAAINFYSAVADLRGSWETDFILEDSFHLRRI